MKTPSDLEQTIMHVLWKKRSCTAEDVREAISRKRLLKDSTVRTLLRRLERKGFIRHAVEGRTYVYEPVVAPDKAAARALRQIVRRFCSGSVERLLTGMVDDGMITAKDLKDLVAKLEAKE